MAAPFTTGKLPWNKEIHQERNKKILNMNTKNHLCTPPHPQYPAVVISINTMQIKSVFFPSFHLDLKNIKVGKSWKWRTSIA